MLPPHCQVLKEISVGKKKTKQKKTKQKENRTQLNTKPFVDSYNGILRKLTIKEKLTIMKLSTKR